MSHLRRKWESIAALPDVAQTQRRATAEHTCPESKRVALQGASDICGMRMRMCPNSGVIAMSARIVLLVMLF